MTDNHELRITAIDETGFVYCPCGWVDFVVTKYPDDARQEIQELFVGHLAAVDA